KKDAYLAVVEPGFGPIGAQTQSINKAQFIATLTKTF
ncbi:hypothetical protein RCH10_002601, partial [Variovorax sp. GrIS 2.14]